MQYDRLKRHSPPRTVRRQSTDTQKQFIRGVLLLIGVTLLIKIATPLPGAELNVTTLPDTENNAVSTLSK